MKPCYLIACKPHHDKLRRDWTHFGSVSPALVFPHFAAAPLLPRWVALRVEELMFAFPAHRGPLTLGCVSLPDRKANEGLLALSQEETMPISIRQLAYGTVPKFCTVCFCVCVSPTS